MATSSIKEKKMKKDKYKFLTRVIVPAGYAIKLSGCKIVVQSDYAIWVVPA